MTDVTKKNQPPTRPFSKQWSNWTGRGCSEVWMRDTALGACLRLYCMETRYAVLHTFGSFENCSAEGDFSADVHLKRSKRTDCMVRAG